jgi:hypothetical protein
MNLSAERATRKWPCRRVRAAAVAMVTAAAALLLLGWQTGPAAAAAGSGQPHLVQNPLSLLFGESRPRPRRARLPIPASIPLPKPRPAEAPPTTEADRPNDENRNDNGDKTKAEQPAPAPGDRPAAPAATPAPPPPSACRLALTDAVAIAPSIPDIHGAGGCGGEDLVRLEAIVLPDKRRVAVTPAAILRCRMASEIADWVRTDVAPMAAGLGSAISGLDNFDSFECRGRNRVAGAPLSEHGRANALDVRALKLADGRSISLTDRTVPRELRENVLHSVCARFVTVLGPGSDGYHEDHIHLDLMERHNNYKICHWEVWDALPRIAPLMPAPRPDEAPPRELAAKSDANKSDVKPDPKPDATQSETAQPDAAEPADAAAEAPAKKPPTKKRRKNRRSLIP